jgi:K+-sensing histidine kinase KdpD
MTSPDRPIVPAGTQAAAGQDAASGPQAAAGPQTSAGTRTADGQHGTTRSRAAGWFSRDHIAIAAGLAGPLALAAILVPFRSSFPNTDAALAMILLVVVVAAIGNRLAGYVAALSTAVWFDFFLTRPYETFTINRATDIETTVLLLVIGVAVTEIAVWGRRQHAAASRRTGYLEGINAAARVVATGSSPAALTDRVAASLTQLLSLRSCQFQYGIAGIGRPARLHNDGRVVFEAQTYDLHSVSLPEGTDIELLVESGGRLQGRFLMQPEPSARPTREQLLVATALADQVGAALAASYPAET